MHHDLAENTVRLKCCDTLTLPAFGVGSAPQQVVFWEIKFMSEQKEKLAKYKAEAEEQLKASGESKIDDAMLTERCNALRVLMNNRDALYVAGTDPSELETVRKNFIVKKLGIEDKAKGEATCKAVAEKMKSSRMKNRAAFYYLCAKALG